MMSSWRRSRVLLTNSGLTLHPIRSRSKDFWQISETAIDRIFKIQNPTNRRPAIVSQNVPFIISSPTRYERTEPLLTAGDIFRNEKQCAKRGTPWLRHQFLSGKLERKCQIRNRATHVTPLPTVRHCREAAAKRNCRSNKAFVPWRAAQKAKYRENEFIQFSGGFSCCGPPEICFTRLPSINATYVFRQVIISARSHSQMCLQLSNWFFSNFLLFFLDR